MNLQEFIAESLLQIINGVKEAQTGSADTGAHINPAGLIMPQEKISAPYHPNEDTYSSYIEFDVAITVTEGAERKGGIGVAAGIFAIGGQGKTETQSGTISRIKFSVPVMLPSGKNLRPRNRERLQEQAETDFDPYGS